MLRVQNNVKVPTTNVIQKMKKLNDSRNLMMVSKIKTQVSRDRGFPAKVTMIEGIYFSKIKRTA